MHDSPVITLLQPESSSGLSSGSDHCHGELDVRLVAISLGHAVECAPEDLEQACEQRASSVLVFDGRYVASALPPVGMKRAHRALLLLHSLPSLDAALDDTQSARLAAAERAWIDAVDTVVTTSSHVADYVGSKYGKRAIMAMRDARPHVETAPANMPPGAMGTGAMPGVAGKANRVTRLPLVILDLDGVVQFGESIPDEAIELVRELRADGFTLRFLTNDGINSRDTRLERMARLGFEIPRDELYTASYLTARYVKERGFDSILGLLARPASDEFTDVTWAGSSAQAVIVGDYFPHYDYEQMKAAYEALSAGAELVAMHRKPSWPLDGKRVIDIGFWVAGLEYCAARPATVVGKPDAYGYRVVLADAGYGADEAIMVSDEVLPDLAGARDLGIETLLFGEERHGDADAHRIAPSYSDVRAALLEHCPK